MYIVPMLFIGILFSLIQISIFKSLPTKIRKIMAYFPPIGVLANFFGSYLILIFTGTAMIVGTANIFASLIFGIYLLLYRYVRQINRIETQYKFKIIPIIKIIENKPHQTGILKEIF